MIKKELNINLEKICQLSFGVYICMLYSFIEYRIYAEITFILLYLCTYKKITINFYFYWSILWLIFNISSNLWSHSILSSLRGTLGILEIVLLGNIIISFINKISRIHFLMKTFILAGILLILKILYITPFKDLLNGRIGNKMYNANMLGIKLCISFIFLIYYFLNKRELKIRSSLLGVIFIFFILLTGSRKAVFFLFLGSLLLIINNTKKKAHLFLISIFLISLGIFGYWGMMNNEILYNIIGIRIEKLLNIVNGIKSTDASTRERVLFIEKGITIWKKKLFFGYGTQTFADVSRLGVYSHNNFIEILVSGGIIGIVSYYSIYIFIFYSYIKNFYKKKYKETKIFFIIILIFFINDLGLVSYGEEYIQIILATTISMIYLNKKLRKRDNEKIKKNNYLPV